jgi:hypothetical protein
MAQNIAILLLALNVTKEEACNVLCLLTNFYSPHHKLHRMIDANRLSPNIISAVHRIQPALIFFTSVWSE